MHQALAALLALVQAQAEGAAAPAAAADGGPGNPADPAAPARPPGLFELLQSIAVPLLLVGGAFYFLILLPDRKKQKAKTERLAALQKGDQVVTIGGVHGTVVKVSADRQLVTLRVDEATGAKLDVSQAAVATVLTKDGKAADT